MLEIPSGPQDIATLSGPFALKFELARRLVARFHGWAEANKAAMEWVRVVSLGLPPSDVPTVMLEHACPVYLPDLFLEQGLVSSKNEARRLIDQGAVRIEGQKHMSHTCYFYGPQEDVRIGKRRHLRVLPRYRKQEKGDAEEATT